MENSEQEEQKKIAKEKADFLKSLLLEKKVHVIDNFLPDPERYLKLARESDFKTEKNVNYPGVVRHLAGDDLFLLRDLMGSLIPMPRNISCAGRFRKTEEKDNGTQGSYIHYDNWTFRILVYLNPRMDDKEIPEWGTRFYQHKKINLYRARTDLNPKDATLQSLISADHYFNDWDCWLQVPFKFNRALVFDGHLFHSGPLKLEGDQFSNSRVGLEFHVDRKVVAQILGPNEANNHSSRTLKES